MSCHGDESWGSLSQALASPLVLILAGVLLGVAILLVARRRRVPEALTSQPFERGFDLLLEARWQDAAEVLSAAVKTDPNRTLNILSSANCFGDRGNQGGQHACSSSSEPVPASTAAWASWPSTN